MRKLFLIVIMFQCVVILFAQNSEDLFMQKEFRNAYENKTRSYDGKPGVNYFQNQTDYKIKAEFFPVERKVVGSEIITYTNNSPDTLKRIYIKLYQNLYKKGVARDWDLGKIDIHEGVEIKSITVNDEEIDIENRLGSRSTMIYFRTPTPITPKSKSTIKVEWSLVIPARVNIRMGTYDKTNFMLAYWYPKVAVYDDIDGWQRQPHTGSCEFYNEFGDFDVEMTVPGDYNVWSTGILQNAKEIYTSEFVKKIEKASKSDEIIHIITKEDREKANITKKADKHTWKFKIDNMPDFAFAISNKYIWDGSSIKIGNKRILVNAVYKHDAIHFQEVAEIAKFCIKYFTTVTPAIEFPYPQMTAFSGHGGMEFPGMINDGDTRSRNGTLSVTSHEVGHSYFPFYVGTNEQKYAWIDEGLTSFYPREIIEKLTDEEGFHYFTESVRTYNYIAGSFSDVPLMVESTNTRGGYYFHAYMRSSVAFYQLREYIGKELFNKSLQEYARRWNGKHPVPYDLFATFNHVVGEDLAWFWKPWFFDLGAADLAVGEYKSNKLTINNKGGFPVPINLTVVYADGSEKQIKEKANVWKRGNSTFEINIPKGKVSKFILDSKLTPDAFPKNNVKQIN